VLYPVKMGPFWELVTNKLVSTPATRMRLWGIFKSLIIGDKFLTSYCCLHKGVCVLQ
jgi:hypothetical protein